MQGWGREIALALASAFLGALAAYWVQQATTPRRELTILTASLRSRTSDYAIPEEPGIPAYGIDQYSIKNSGDRALKDVTLEFAPAGGDMAYDTRHRQRIWHASLREAERYGRLGSHARVKGNTLYIRYDYLKPGEVDTVVITHDDTAASYDISVSDPDVSLVEQSARTDLMPDPSLTGLGRSLFDWRTLLVVAIASAAAALGAAWTLARLRKSRIKGAMHG